MAYYTNRTAVLVAMTALLLAITVKDASACSCFPTSFYSKVRQSENVNKIRIIGEVSINKDGRIVGPRDPSEPLDDINGQRYYRARVLRSFNGCVKAKSDVIVETGGNSALCGAFLSPNTVYLFNTFVSSFTDVTELPSLSVNICGLIREWLTLTRPEKWFLRQQIKTCDGVDSCNNNVNLAAVTCPAATCESLAPCPMGSFCETNPCRRCGIDWYKEEDFGFAEVENLIIDGSCGTRLPRFFRP